MEEELGAEARCGSRLSLVLCPQELEQQGSIYTKGCVGQFEKWLQDNLIVVAGVLVGIALLQVRPWPHPFPLPEASPLCPQAIYPSSPALCLTDIWHLLGPEPRE